MHSKTKELKKYWDSTAVSQSFLKRKTMAGTGDDDSPDTKSTFRGNLLDSLMTSPEIFKDLFYLSPIEKKPTDGVKKILDSLIEIGEDKNLYDLKDLIVIVAKENKFQSNWKEDTIINSVLKDVEYYNEMRVSRGRELVSKEEYDLTLTQKNALLYSSITNKYFKASDSVHEIKYQTSLFSDIEHEPCKGLTDILVFNHQDKTIREIDLKTTGVSRNEFNLIARKYRYDFQKSWYKQLLINIYGQEWSIINGYWMVVPNNNKPFIQKVSDEDYHIGEFGACKVKGELLFDCLVEGNGIKDVTQILGWRDSLDIYKQVRTLQEQGYMHQYDFDLTAYHNNNIYQHKSIWV